MAFWGIEVKPGNPVTHKFDQVRGRLRLSQATLGLGSSIKKSLVQCNIGDKSPVFLCVLMPDKTESCHLDLEFEEADDVVFSVIGPRSVYLTGYYVGSRFSNQNDNTESYGEDIANSEAEDSVDVSDEDKYDDSFIDDGDPEVIPPSPNSSDIASDEEKPKKRKTKLKRLKKKYHSIESEDDNNSHLDDDKFVSVLNSEDEDKFPISSLFRNRSTEAEEKMENDMTKTDDEKITVDRPHAPTQDGVPVSKTDNGESETVVFDKKTERGSDPQHHLLLPSDGLEVNPSKSRNKRKERTKGSPEADGEIYINVMKNEKTLPDKEHEQKPATERECDSSLPSAKSDVESGKRPKKRRKESCDDGKHTLSSKNADKVFKEDKVKQNDGGAQESDKDIISKGNEQDQKFPLDKNNSTASNSKVDEDLSEYKKGKRRKKSKSKEKEEIIGNDTHSLAGEAKNILNAGSSDKKVESEIFQARTLSNGLIIQELQMGNPEGKTATSGKKIKVHYVGKLKERGQIIDSNIGKSPLKFRLGAENVIEGWNIGLEGMRVGGKRRLTIPPTMGYGSQGTGENVPPKSWLVYEFELVGVR